MSLILISKATVTTLAIASFLAVALVMAAMTQSPRGQFEARERILFNAKVFTGDPLNSYAEAVGIRGGRFFAVGSLADVVSLASPEAERSDLGGRTLLPGFVDSHIHAIDGGFASLAADATDKAETLNQLKAFVAEARRTRRGLRGDILEILGVPLTFWKNFAELSNLFNTGDYRQQPVLLRGLDYHTAWANHALMRRAEITAEYVRSLSEEQRRYFGTDARSEPNGLLVDAGLTKVTAILPPRTLRELLTAARAAIRSNYSLGITAWLEPKADKVVIDAYRMLAEANELSSHVVALPEVFARDPVDEVASVLKMQAEYRNIPNLHITGVKIFADGVAEYPSQTAYFTKPYRNSGRNGSLLFNPSQFNALCVEADKKGLFVHVHAIGDGAVRVALDGIAAARIQNGRSHIAHSITHAQFVAPNDLFRFRKFGIIASLQLFWALADPAAIDLIQPYVAEQTFQMQYPARSLLNNGANIAGASDFPVSTADVFAAIYQAETRRGPLGVLNINEAVPRASMLYAYTRNAAMALNLQDEIGTIAPGKAANLVLVDRDVLTVSPEELRKSVVLWTMVSGRMVYVRPEK